MWSLVDIAFGEQHLDHFRTTYPIQWTLQWRHNERDGFSNHQPHHCLLNRLVRRRSKKTSKLRDTGLCAENLPVTGEFPAQMTSNAENVSIWWCDHGSLDQALTTPEIFRLPIGQPLGKNQVAPSRFRLPPFAEPLCKQRDRWYCAAWWNKISMKFAEK